MKVNTGKIFELNVKNSIPQDVMYYRIKDPSSSFGQDSSKTRFSLKNEFDVFLYKKPILIAMELKSNKGTSISFATEKGKQADIKFTQIEALSNIIDYEVRAGLLLNFRKTNMTYWLDIENFNKFKDETEKKSINEKDIITYGGIVIPSKKLKTNYRYDLSNLWEER